MRLSLVLFVTTIATGFGFAQTPIAEPILEAQVRLDRAGFSPGEIDGVAGVNLTRAIEAFQRAHGLAVTGTVDAPMRERLADAGGSDPALIEYELAAEDVDGPFVRAIPADLVAQARLRRLGYRNALEGIGERFHASPGLLRRLNPGASFTRAGERVVVPNVGGHGTAPGPGASGTAVRIVVRAATSALTVEDAQSRVLFHAPVTSGSEHDPLPIGTYKVTGVQRMPVFNYNPDLFWDADPKHTRARIAAGPNNPVGVMWIDISKEHYGIHGTPEPSTVGHVQSHGCVRLTNWDVERVSRWARPGTVVVFE